MSIVAIAGTAFTFYLPGLEDQANPGLFKSSPTISAGDFAMSTNGGTFAALTNTPTVSPAGSTQIAIVLSAAETTAAGAGGRITVNCQDSAGAEWYSLGIAIPVQAADISTLGGTAQTGDAYARLTGTVEPAIADVPTVAEFNARTLLAADYTVVSDLPAAPDNASIAAIKGVTDKLDTALELDGAVYRYTVNALERAPTGGVLAGSGTGYYSDTLESPGGTPVDGARVMLATDEDGLNVAYEARSDAFGVFEMRPDPGTYYRFIEAAGHTFTQGAEVLVEEA